MFIHQVTYTGMYICPAALPRGYKFMYVFVESFF